MAVIDSPEALALARQIIGEVRAEESLPPEERAVIRRDRHRKLRRWLPEHERPLVTLNARLRALRDRYGPIRTGPPPGHYETWSDLGELLAAFEDLQYDLIRREEQRRGICYAD